MKTLKSFFKRFVGVFLLLVALTALSTFRAMAQTPVPPAGAFDFGVILQILLKFGELAGFAAAISAIVQVLKWAGAIPDGAAGSWFAVLDLLAMGALVFLHFYAPTVEIGFLDSQAATLANILLIILGYVTQLKVGSGTAGLFRTMQIPVLGASHADGTLRGMKRTSK